MNIAFTPDGWKELQQVLGADRQLHRKAIGPIEAAARDPFSGIGKPEPVKHHLTGCWSRRISERHRQVYRVEGDTLQVLGCMYHYGE